MTLWETRSSTPSSPSSHHSFNWSMARKFSRSSIRPTQPSLATKTTTVPASTPTPNTASRLQTSPRVPLTSQATTLLPQTQWSTSKRAHKSRRMDLSSTRTRLSSHLTNSNRRDKEHQCNHSNKTSMCYTKTNNPPTRPRTSVKETITRFSLTCNNLCNRSTTQSKASSTTTRTFRQYLKTHSVLAPSHSNLNSRRLTQTIKTKCQTSRTCWTSATLCTMHSHIINKL